MPSIHLRFEIDVDSGLQKRMHSGSAFESQQQQHRRGLSLSSSVANDRDDDLTLFREMQRREREYKPSIPEQPGMQTPRTGPKPLDQSLHRVPASSTPIKSYGADDLLSSDWGKNDYDWLMTPPGTPLFLPVDCDPINSDVSCVGTASVGSALKTSKLGNSKSEPPSRAEHQSKSVRGNLGLQQPLNVNSIGSASSLMSAKPVFSGVSRSSTQGFNPGVRHPVPSPRHAPVGAISSSRLSSSIATTGMPQGTLQNGGVHTATPSSRAGVPNVRSACSSRPSTPLKRSPSSSHPCNPPTTLVRCASANRASSFLSKGSRPCSPTSKAWFPEALHGFSQDRPPNLRTSMPERSLSNSRSSTSKAFQVEQSDTGVWSRQQSSSSVVARPTSSASQNGAKVSHMNAKSDCNAAEMLASNGSASKLGVKAMREKKPMMCSQEGQSLVLEPHVKKPVRSTPLRDVKSIFSSMYESSALGRNPSKKSLDLTLRRMDICKGTPQKIRSFMSSMSKPRALLDQGVKGSGNNGNHSTSSVMDSPMATSSTSSEQNMSIVIDPEGSEIGDESISEKGSRSSAASQHDLFLLGKEKRISSWLRSPDYRDDDADIMQIFEQEGLESLSGPESPLISDLNGTIECDNFCLDPI